MPLRGTILLVRKRAWGGFNECRVTQVEIRKFGDDLEDQFDQKGEMEKWALCGGKTGCFQLSKLPQCLFVDTKPLLVSQITWPGEGLPHSVALEESALHQNDLTRHKGTDWIGLARTVTEPTVWLLCQSVLSLDFADTRSWLCFWIYERCIVKLKFLIYFLIRFSNNSYVVVEKNLLKKHFFDRLFFDVDVQKIDVNINRFVKNVVVSLLIMKFLAVLWRGGV